MISTYVIKRPNSELCHSGYSQWSWAKNMFEKQLGRHDLQDKRCFEISCWSLFDHVCVCVVMVIYLSHITYHHLHVQREKTFGPQVGTDACIPKQIIQPACDLWALWHHAFTPTLGKAGRRVGSGGGAIKAGSSPVKSHRHKSQRLKALGA